jgi:protein-ribulosamine 3-kinase
MENQRSPCSSLTMALSESIALAISRATGQAFRVDRCHSAGGGCINTTEVLLGQDQQYFVKLNSAARLHMFEAEAAGLREMETSNTIRVPTPICTGEAEGQAFLVLEFLDLSGRGGAATDRALGKQLAALHQTRAEHFGWWRNNTIGSTPQINNRENDWASFYREHRLRFQLELAADNGGPHLLREGEKLLETLPAFFTDYQPVPSLLHGDLWGGNHGALHDGTPVIFDPAVYYGDREADIAMTELFGGFGSGFYAAYSEAWPLDPGYRVRKDLYNLYHILNHFNLFGGGYAGQAERLIQSLLVQAR